jgi:hypothetical protein
MTNVIINSWFAPREKPPITTPEKTARNKASKLAKRAKAEVVHDTKINGTRRIYSNRKKERPAMIKLRKLQKYDNKTD